MAQNIQVGFKVTGSELSNYIESIAQKSKKMSDDAVHSAIDQTEKEKELLKIIKDQIDAIERKNKANTEWQSRRVREPKSEQDSGESKANKLSEYIESIQKKSSKIASDAISAAIGQTDSGEEQLRVINAQIAAIEKRTRVETQALRSLAIEDREAKSKELQNEREVRSNEIYHNRNLSDEDKSERLAAIDAAYKSDEADLRGNYRENLTSIREQERQAKLQTTLAKEQVAAIKQTARENVKAITNGDKTLEEVIKSAQTDDEKLVAKLTEEGLVKERRTKGNEKGGGKESIFGSLLAVDNLNKFIAATAQFTQTQNGFDLIQPAANTAGRVIGAVLGAVVGGISTGGAGAVSGAGVGAAIGGALGDGIGALKQREAFSKENFLRAAYRYQAITGNDVDGGAFSDGFAFPDMSSSGISHTQFVQLQTDIARKQATDYGAETKAQQAIYLEKGLGIDQSTISNLIELQRSTSLENRNLLELVGGVFSKGQDSIFLGKGETFLNEFLGKFSSFQKELLKYQSTVATGTTMDILTRFNRLGGEFDISDSRAMGNISAIQNSLSNPGTDNLKAYSFAALRRNNPNAGIFDLLEERQKGLSSPGYLNSMLKMLDTVGGDDQSKMLQLSGMFPGLSFSAVRRLYNNRQGLMSGSLSMDELKNTFPSDFKSLSEKNTTDLEKNTAKIENGILQGQAIEKMAEAFEVAIKSMLGGAVIELKDGWGVIRLDGLKNVKTNATKTPTKADYRASGLNEDGRINPSSYLNKY